VRYTTEDTEERAVSEAKAKTSIDHQRRPMRCVTPNPRLVQVARSGKWGRQCVKE